jgi:hypothetical protein
MVPLPINTDVLTLGSVRSMGLICIVSTLFVLSQMIRATVTRLNSAQTWLPISSNAC